MADRWNQEKKKERDLASFWSFSRSLTNQEVTLKSYYLHMWNKIPNDQLKELKTVVSGKEKWEWMGNCCFPSKSCWPSCLFNLCVIWMKMNPSTPQWGRWSMIYSPNSKHRFCYKLHKHHCNGSLLTHCVGILQLIYQFLCYWMLFASKMYLDSIVMSNPVHKAFSVNLRFSL